MEKRIGMVLYGKKHQPISHKIKKKEFDNPLILTRSSEGNMNYHLHQLNLKPMLVSLKEKLKKFGIKLNLADVCVRSNSGTIYTGPLEKYLPDQSIDSCTMKNIPTKSYRHPIDEIKIQLTAEEHKTKYLVGFKGLSENESLVSKVVDALNTKFLNDIYINGF